MRQAVLESATKKFAELLVKVRAGTMTHPDLRNAMLTHIMSEWQCFIFSADVLYTLILADACMADPGVGQVLKASNKLNNERCGHVMA